ncbi:MAG: hypothetical protein RL220_1945 [Bacteroidota bacterium]
MKNIDKLIVLTALLMMSLAGSVGAQQHLIYLNDVHTWNVERNIDTSIIHLGAKPFVQSRLNLTTTPGFSKDTSKYYYEATVKLWRDHLIKVEKEDFSLYVDPLFDFSVSRDFADTTEYADSINIWNNSRGLVVEGNIGNSVGFRTGVLENQAFLPLYLKEFADSLAIVPGMGRWKRYRASGYDYSMSFGHLGIRATRWLDLFWGYGKNFIGHGYRSLLLSDAGFNYPYLRAVATLAGGKVQYSAIHASLQTLERMPLGEVPESLFKRKGAGFHYLSWAPSRKLEIGLFEGIIYQRWDSTGTKSLPWNAYVPAIGLASVVYGLNDKMNVVTGLNVRYAPTRKLHLYGQFMADDPERDAIGFQIGWRYCNLLKGLDLGFEYNQTGTYSYASVHELQNYEHYNQPLGHPAGGDTKEWIARLRYQYRAWFFSIKANRLSHDTGFEGDLFHTVHDITELPVAAPTRSVAQWELQTGFRFNRHTNLEFLAGYTDRMDEQGDFRRHTGLVYLAFRTNLFNRYVDF